MTTSVIVATAVGIAIWSTANTQNITDRSQDLSLAQAGAEGAVEYAFGIWKARIAQKYAAIDYTQNSSDPTTTMGTPWNPPSFTGVNFTDTGAQALSLMPTDQYGVPQWARDAGGSIIQDSNGNRSVKAVPMTIDVPGYPGWRGRGYYYLASAKASVPSVRGAPAQYGVKRYFSYVEVPLFQTMFFFEHDIELYRPAKMTIGGLAHTNRWGFISNDASSGVVTFQGNISHVLGFRSDIIPYRAETWSGYNSAASAHTAVTTQGSVTKVDRLEPFGQDPSSLMDPAPSGPYSPTIDGKVGQLIGPDGDSDGNPNNDSMHELIEPPVTTGSPAPTDPQAIAKRRIYGKSGIVITVDGSTKTVTTQNGTSLTSTQITTIKNAITTTASMYDRREQTNVHITNVKVADIVTTLNAATGFNGVLYIDDVTATTASVPKNAIRLTNAGVLPTNGLTVATQDGLYVQGDYNTGTTTNPTSVPSNGGNSNNDKSPTITGYSRKPAALIADAVTILSNAWSDANANKSIDYRTASNTTVNAALLAGFMPSGYTPASGSQYGYSGGANNYPRFLEDWGSKYLTYFGSMVELFQSKTFTGRWDTGDIYSPPTRSWNYDTNYDTTSPPGSLDAIASSRGTWMRF